MTLNELKNAIEFGSLSDINFIFTLGKESDFIARQYYTQIAKRFGYNISYEEECTTTNTLLFNSDFEKILHVHYCDVYDDTPTNDTIIVCIKSSNESAIPIPKLEDWQIKDYVYSICDGVKHEKLDWLISVAHNDMYRIQSELDKLLMFHESLRDTMFDEFLQDGVFTDLTNKTIFDFTNAIQKRNIQEVVSIYKQIDNADVEPLGLVTILISNFKKLISVLTAKNPTAESTGLTNNQIWAIKNSSLGYSESQLCDIYIMLCDIDKKLKTGDLPADYIRDIVTLFTLSA